MHCEFKLNVHQSDCSHYSQKTNKIHNLFEFIVIIKFVLPSHDSETHFSYENLVIVQIGATPFIMFIFCLKLFFRIMFVKKTFDVAMSTTKLYLYTTYNHLNVLFYV